MPRIALLALLILATAPPPAEAQQGPRDTLVGAVRLIETGSHAIEITTGVGLALRIVRLDVPHDLQVTAGNASVPFIQLKPGDVVRVSFGTRPTGYIAYTIERVGRMDQSPARTP